MKLHSITLQYSVIRAMTKKQYRKFDRFLKAEFNGGYTEYHSLISGAVVFKA